ncbi:MAG: replicative DNA helicase [Planctomycetes bacterium]|jgi:replicative DNA helicase|nr:replicative DNA helicase [Planctomycetota bacterium]
MTANPVITASGSSPYRRRDRGFDDQHKAELPQLFEKLPPHAVEAEAALLGSMLHDWRVCGEVLQIVKSGDDFYLGKHAAIYQVLIELYDQHQSIDMVQLNQKLADKQMLDQVGGLDYLLELLESVPSAASAEHYARIVREKAVLRGLIDSAGRILYDAYHSDQPAQELLEIAEKQIFDIAQFGSTDHAAELKDLLQETFDRLEADDGRLITGIGTGFYELDEMTNGLQPGEMIIIAARPSMGKAQPLDARVLRDDGWTTMGELRVGDALASVDGQPSHVTGIFPQGRRQVYRVAFSDGRSAECCAEHLWRVSYREWDEPRVLQTSRLIEMLGRKRYQNRLFVEAFSGVFGREIDCPIDPWVLGCLLGDGSLGGSSLRFSCADPDLLERLDAALGEELTLSPAGGYDVRIVQRDGAHRRGVVGVQPNPVMEALRKYDLWGCGATQKFIPRAFFEASYTQRAALLRGLMDTDGWVERWGSLRYATSSRQLARDVVELMRSLGGSASYTQKQTTYTYQGQRRHGLPTYVCNLQHPDARQFVSVPAKHDRVAPSRQRHRRLNLKSIEPTRVVETQCISVSHPARLYITDDFVVTHNTAFALNIAEHIGATSKQPVAVFSLEMSKQQLAQRLLCSRSGVDSHKLRRNMLSRDDFAKLSLTVGELSEAPLFIDDTPGLSLLGLRAKARRLAARHDIKCIVIDYLQLMAAPGSESRQQEVSNLSRGIKALARELSVPVLCLSQLNRQAEQREGHRPRMSDLRESGSIEQDADVVMMLHREDYYHRGDDEYVDTNQAEVILAKQRNGPTGTVKLAFHGPTTRFNNLASGGGGY